MGTFHLLSPGLETKEYAPSPRTSADGKFDDAAANAVSFGFIATAILISLFLVIGIFERLLRPRVPLPSGDSSSDQLNQGVLELQNRISSTHKPEDQQPVSVIEVGISVLMPGQTIPSYIAHPAPYPCPHENASLTAEQAQPETMDAQKHQSDMHTKAEHSIANSL